MLTSKLVFAKLVFALAFVATLSGCGGGGSDNGPHSQTALAFGFSLRVFAQAPLPIQSPDSIVRYGDTVFIAYQNKGEVKDGSNPAVTNAVVQYDLNGNLLKTYTVPGHCDGLWPALTR